MSHSHGFRQGPKSVMLGWRQERKRFLSFLIQILQEVERTKLNMMSGSRVGASCLQIAKFIGRLFHAKFVIDWVIIASIEAHQNYFTTWNLFNKVQENFGIATILAGDRVT